MIQVHLSDFDHLIGERRDGGFPTSGHAATTIKHKMIKGFSVFHVLKFCANLHLQASDNNSLQACKDSSFHAD